MVIDGDVPADRAAAVEAGLARTAAELELEGVTLFVTADLPDGLVGAASPRGIFIRPEQLAGDGVSAAATLLEEIAHYRMITLGATHSGLDTFPGALIHEFYATWYTWTRLRERVEDLDERFNYGPLPLSRPTPEFGYALGTFLGAAEAGVEPARDRVAAWFAGGTAEPGMTALANRLRGMAAQAPTPVGLARDLLVLFPRD